MLTTITNFISPIKTLITPYINYIQIVAFVIALGGLGVLYYTWKESVRAEAILKYKTQVLEQLIQDEKNNSKFLESKIEITNKLVEEKDKKITELENNLNALEKSVQEKFTDEEAHQLLKDTLDAIMKAR